MQENLKKLGEKKRGGIFLHDRLDNPTVDPFSHQLAKMIKPHTKPSNQRINPAKTKLYPELCRHLLNLLDLLTFQF